jgi:hypothetical protein
LKEEALDHTLWRTRFGRGYGPVVRQTAEWMSSVSVTRLCSQWHNFCDSSKDVKVHEREGPWACRRIAVTHRPLWSSCLDWRLLFQIILNVMTWNTGYIVMSSKHSC